MAGNAQHGMGGCYVVPRIRHFRNAQLEMVEIDVNAAAVFGEKLASPVLGLVVVVGRTTVLRRAAVLPPTIDHGLPVCGRVVIAIQLAPRQSPDRSQQSARSFAAATARIVHTKNKIPQLEVGSADFEEPGRRVVTKSISHHVTRLKYW